MTAETINAWFTPFHDIVYLGTILIFTIGFLQWQWSRTCKNNIQVLVAEQGGGGKFHLLPKAGGSVTIRNPATNTYKTWPISELATVDVPYPGIGLVPAFLQKTIKMTIVMEGDWEPLLNRSPHRAKVVSPDIAEALLDISNKAAPETKEAILKLLDNVATSPTREMIASPAVLGNLMQEKITELAVTIARDIINPINEAIKRMGQRVSPAVVYIGLGLILIMVAFLLFRLLPVAGNLEKIMESLGIT